MSYIKVSLKSSLCGTGVPPIMRPSLDTSTAMRGSLVRVLGMHPGSEQ